MAATQEILDLLKFLATMPWPTLLIWIGVVMIFVGFGAEIGMPGFDLTKLNKTFALVAGTVSLPVGTFANIRKLWQAGDRQAQGKDPWLPYYIVSTLFLVALCWIVMLFVSGTLQVQVMIGAFRLVAALVAIAVLWRALSVYSYLKAPKKSTLPLDLYERHDYLPYFALIAGGVLAIVAILFVYTKSGENMVNRQVLFNSFLELCVYLLFSRFLWEVVDWFARRRIPRQE